MRTYKTYYIGTIKVDIDQANAKSHRSIELFGADKRPLVFTNFNKAQGVLEYLQTLSDEFKTFKVYSGKVIEA